VHPTTARPTITVTTDGTGVVSHVGSRLPAGMADRRGPTAAFSDALSGLRERRSAHDPGRVLTDLAVCSPTAGARSATSRLCVTSRRCSGRSRPRRPRGACWTKSTRCCSTGYELLVR
jgi:hypothetical protein